MIWFLTKSNNYTSIARLIKRHMTQLGDLKMLKPVKQVSAVTKMSATVTKYFIVGYCVVETFGNFVGWPASINGKSMQPTLLGCQDVTSDSWCWRQVMSEWVWVNCWRAKQDSINRGDIIVYVSPKNPNELLIKRVIALEGDIVDLDTDTSYPLTRLRIPSGHIWVHGDNRAISVDSNK